MSVKHTSWVWEHSQSQGKERLVLLCLADMMGDHGDDSDAPAQFFCWPKVDTIAAKTRLSRSSTLRALAALTESGELAAEDRHTRGKSSRYWLPALEVPSVSLTPGSAQSDTSLVSLVTPQGTVTETSLEPSIGDSAESPTLEMETELHPDLIAPSPDQEFEEIWKMWCPPRDCPKGNKQAARKAYLRHNKVGLTREMAQAVMSLYADDMHATNKGRNDAFQQQWSHLSTLLNDWEQYAERIKAAEEEKPPEPLDDDALFAQMLSNIEAN